MINSIKEVDKIIGDMLVKQSELQRGNVVNGCSARGVDLSKFVTEKVKLSYDLSDSVIIFEIKSSNNNEVDFTEAENDVVRESLSLEVSVIIYGNQSLTLAKMLKARFESEKVRNDLLDKNVYLSSVNEISFMNEFINETIWPRADFTMSIACEIQVSQIDEMSEINKADVTVNT